MNFKAIIIPFGCLVLGACVPDGSVPVTQTPSPQQQELDQITGLAGPNQNIQSARLRADDNCYWVSYAGPVETTELPLLTPDGRHICAAKPVIDEVAT